jgi:hypothetical protein
MQHEQGSRPRGCSSRRDHVHRERLRLHGPAEISAGAVTLRLLNEGQEMHHAVLARLDSGRTLDDVLRFYADRNDPLLREHPAFLTYMGGPGTGVPGSTFDATAVLEPGEYILICYVPSADGQVPLPEGDGHEHHRHAERFPRTRASCNGATGPPLTTRSAFASR